MDHSSKSYLSDQLYSDLDMSGHTEDDDNEDIWKERCNDCVPCNVIEDCKTCSACRNNKTCKIRRCFAAKKIYNEKVKKATDENLKQILAKTAAREAQSAASYSQQTTAEPEKKKRGRKKGSLTAASTRKITERDYVPLRPTRQQSADMRKKRTLLNTQQEKQPRQCLNPDCIHQARDESKYCSDDCGRTLARIRLTEILPVRCREYFSVARSQEEKVKQRQNVLDREMKDLAVSEKNMVRFLEKLHGFVETLSKKLPEATEERDDDNVVEACVVCGQPDVPLRKYVKHIELCWSRSEKAISFAAPEQNNDRIYCEKHDARTNTYCKRLKSLCPEHKKPGPENCLKICGFPKKWEIGESGNSRTMAEMIDSEDPFGEEGCMTKKEACLKHHKWLPSLKGSIELEQACLYQKVYEIVHETAKLKIHAEWTTNALSILMHKSPTIVDQDGFASFLRAQKASTSFTEPSTSSAADTSISSKTNDESFVDPAMSETAEVLASLAFRTEGVSTNKCIAANVKPSNPTAYPNIPGSSEVSPKSNFTVARLLE